MVFNEHSSGVWGGLGVLFLWVVVFGVVFWFVLFCFALLGVLLVLFCLGLVGCFGVFFVAGDAWFALGSFFFNKRYNPVVVVKVNYILIY